MHSCSKDSWTTATTWPDKVWTPPFEEIVKGSAVEAKGGYVRPVVAPPQQVGNGGLVRTDDGWAREVDSTPGLGNEMGADGKQEQHEPTTARLKRCHCLCCP